MKKKTIKKLSTKDIKVLDKKTMNKVVGGIDTIETHQKNTSGAVCIGNLTI